jgi:hypothetical protein
MKTLEEKITEAFDWFYGMGWTLSMVISWSLHGSIHLALAHGICSWGYVIYFMIKTGKF